MNVGGDSGECLQRTRVAYILEFLRVPKYGGKFGGCVIAKRNKSASIIASYSQAPRVCVTVGHGYSLEVLSATTLVISDYCFPGFAKDSSYTLGSNWNSAANARR